MAYGNPNPTNYMLRSMLEGNNGFLTIDVDTMPRDGESECERIVRCYGVEYALDVLEDGVIEDGIVDTILRIDGYIFDTDDPMFAGAVERDSMAITKTFKSRDLPATRKRWASLGRSIDSVKVIEAAH